MAGSVVGVLASAFITTAAFAEVHIVDDPGGEVSEYVEEFQELRKAGEHLVIDGPCLSACTCSPASSQSIMFV